MSRLLVDDVTKTDARALLNVNKMATISDIVAPSNEYIYASGANELTVVEGPWVALEFSRQRIPFLRLLIWTQAALLR